MHKLCVGNLKCNTVAGCIGALFMAMAASLMTEVLWPSCVQTCWVLGAVCRFLVRAKVFQLLGGGSIGVVIGSATMVSVQQLLMQGLHLTTTCIWASPSMAFFAGSVA